jgi:hypothetical protein
LKESIFLPQVCGLFITKKMVLQKHKQVFTDIHNNMRFKEWLLETSVDMANPAPAAPDPTKVAKATTAGATRTLDQFGSKFTGALLKAPSPSAGLNTAIKFAQKTGDPTTGTGQSPTNPIAVGSKMVQIATGKAPKIT